MARERVREMERWGRRGMGKKGKWMEKREGYRQRERSIWRGGNGD